MEKEVLKQILDEGMDLISHYTSYEEREIWKNKYYNCINNYISLLTEMKNSSSKLSDSWKNKYCNYIDNYISILIEMKNLNSKVRHLSGMIILNQMEIHYCFNRMVIRANSIFDNKLCLKRNYIPNLKGIELINIKSAIEIYLSEIE